MHAAVVDLYPSSRSRAMRDVLALAERAAEDPSVTIAILGETGVGKGWLAEQIHEWSPRRDGPFVALNSASIAQELAESELFGHVRGAFTGADSEKRGLVEVADGGTLFLDEVAELSVAVQVRLLTFLDSRIFRPVGGLTAKSADVRIVAATNADLGDRVSRGLFRADLFHRIAVVPIVVPPLRERLDDLPVLVGAQLREMAASKKRTVRLGRTAMESLTRHDWPGNVRELRNVVERAVVLSRDVIETFTPFIAHTAREDATYPERLEDAMRTHILRVLDRASGNRTVAAKRLGIGRSTLKRRLCEYGDADAAR